VEESGKLCQRPCHCEFLASAAMMAVFLYLEREFVLAGAEA